MAPTLEVSWPRATPREAINNVLSIMYNEFDMQIEEVFVPAIFFHFSLQLRCCTSFDFLLFL